MNKKIQSYGKMEIIEKCKNQIQIIVRGFK